MLDSKIVLNAPKKANAQSRLIINPDFDFKLFELSILSSLISEIQERFDPLNSETKGANSVLIHDLLITIDKITKQDEIYTPKPLDQYPTDDIYTPKQLQNMAMDQQKKTVKKLRKNLVDHARKKLQDIKLRSEKHNEK